MDSLFYFIIGLLLFNFFDRCLCQYYRQVLSTRPLKFPAITWDSSAEEVMFGPGHEFSIWSKWTYCPENGAMAGYQLKTHSNSTDQGGIVGIRYFCNNFGQPDLSNLTIDPVPWGEWSEPVLCSDGLAVGFQAQLDTNMSSIEDFRGISNFALFCTVKWVEGESGAEDGELKMLTNLNSKFPTWGDWKKPQFCAPTETICRMIIAYDPDPNDVSGIHKFELGCCNDLDTDFIEEYLSRNYHKRLPGVILYAPMLNQSYFNFGNSPSDYFLSFPHKNKAFDYPYWQFWHFCSFPHYILGFKVKLGKERQIQGIKFICADPLKPSSKYLIGPGSDSGYSEGKTCPDGGVMVGVDVFYNSKKFIRNIRLYCSFSKTDENKYIDIDFSERVVRHDETDWDMDEKEIFQHSKKHEEKYKTYDINWARNASKEFFHISGWIGPKFCPPFQAICGFKINAGATMVEGRSEGPLDLRLRCCELQDPVATCFPEDKYELTTTCDNPKNPDGSSSTMKCVITSTEGYSETVSNSVEISKEKSLEQNLRNDHNQMYRSSKGEVYSSSTDTKYSESYNKLVGNIASVLRGKNSELLLADRYTNSQNVELERSRLDSLLYGQSFEDSVGNTRSETHSENTGHSGTQSATQLRQDEETIRNFESNHKGNSVTAQAGFSGFGFSASLGWTGTGAHDWGKDVSNTKRNSNENSRSATLSKSIDKSASESSENIMRERFESSKTKSFGQTDRVGSGHSMERSRSSTDGRRTEERFDLESRFGWDKMNQISKTMTEGGNSMVGQDIGSSFSSGQTSGFRFRETWATSSSRTWSSEKSFSHEYTLQEPGTIHICQLEGYCSFYTVKTKIIKPIFAPQTCADIK